MYPVEILKFLNTKETPGADKYSPNIKSVSAEPAYIRFTSGPARKHDFIEMFSNRSPGPARHPPRPN